MKQLTHHIGGRTHFSLGQSVLSPQEAVNEIGGVSSQAITISDMNSVNALPFIYKRAKAISDLRPDLKLNFGLIVKVVENIEWRKPKKGEKKTQNAFFCPRIIAKNSEGVSDMMKLLSLANTEERFYVTPQISIQDLIEVGIKGNVFITTGDIDNLFALFNYKASLAKLLKSIKRENLLFELSPVNTAYFDRVNELTLKAASKLNVRTIITRPTLYTSMMARKRDVMACAAGRSTITSRWRTEPTVRNLHPLVEADVNEECSNLVKRMAKRGIDNNDAAHAINESIESTNALADELDYTWKPYDICLPEMSDNPFASLVKLSKEGWKARLEKHVYGFKPNPEDLLVYRDRLKYELSVLKNMGFENYFLLVHQVVNQAKDMEIMVGPGRGSVGGSLVAFLMGITDVDPIRFGLIFERFINPDRLDLPDADLDFMSSRREDIIEWLIEKYGQDHVCGISNYGQMGSSSAIRYVGRVHDLPAYDIACSKQVPKEHGSSKSLQKSVEEVPAIKAFATANPQAWQDAVNLQGVFNIYGQHAAGIVVSGRPIVENGVVERRKGGEVCNWDKSVVEDFGLVKLDILGLSNLDVLRLAKEYVKGRHKIDLDYEDVPLDDPQVLDAFGMGNTNAIFQFESGGMKGLLKSLSEIERLSFDDLSAATALYRPGPMDAGLLDKYVDVKRGNKEIEFPHELCEPALKETYGVMVFQEQVMQVARDLSGFSMTEADTLRKAIGKKDAALMGTMGEKFVQGAIASGMDENDAESLWDDILGFAAYSFNKSHSVAYSMISYLTMWLKIKYPAEFFAASLTILKEEKLPGLVKDCEAAGIIIRPPDINLSSDKFEIHYDKARSAETLVCPFQRLKGLSVKALESIYRARAKKEESTGSSAFESKQDFLDLVEKRTCNIRVQSALDSVGAFAEVEEQIPALHPDRVKDQKAMLPGLISTTVKADRKADLSPYVRTELEALFTEAKSCCKAFPREPVVNAALSGKSAAQFMVIFDAPNWSERDSGVMLKGKASTQTIAALKESGLKPSQGYYTALSKTAKPKNHKKIPDEMMTDFIPILDREIELLKPPVILALGSAAARFLLPDLKGGWEEIAGTSHYDPKRDCTIIIGCNPSMLFFDPSRIDILINAFSMVKDAIE